MPRYKIKYGMDVPAYGEAIIKTTSKNLKRLVRNLHSVDQLIDDWDPVGEMSENHRVLEIWREGKDDEWEIVDSTGFSLDEPEPTSVSTKAQLWIAYNPITDKILGHTNNLAGVILLRRAHMDPNVQILSCGE